MEAPFSGRIEDGRLYMRSCAGDPEVVGVPFWADSALLAAAGIPPCSTAREAKARTPRWSGSISRARSGVSRCAWPSPGSCARDGRPGEHLPPGAEPRGGPPFLRDAVSAPLSIVQVGVGLWGRSWAELVARARGFELAAVVDADKGGRAWAADGLGVPVFRELGRALRSVEADAVLLVSPAATHRELAEAALAAGRHVLTEKPLATSFEDAVAIATAASRSGRRAMVAQNYRFRRQPRALQQLVREGALGALLGVRIACRAQFRPYSVDPFANVGDSAELRYFGSPSPSTRPPNAITRPCAS